MRAFIAIELPLHIKEILYAIQKQIGGENAKIGWVAKKNLHLTLKFIGEVENIDEIHKNLSDVKFNPFKVRLNDFEVCPRGKYTDINYMDLLWVNVEPKENLIKLQQEVDSELLNLFPTYQKFSPHFTLGRVKMIKKKKEFFEVVKKIKVKPIEFEINSFKLMQSKLSKDGSKYFVLKEYKA